MTFGNYSNNISIKDMMFCIKFVLKDNNKLNFMKQECDLLTKFIIELFNLYVDDIAYNNFLFIINELVSNVVKYGVSNSLGEISLYRYDLNKVFLVITNHVNKKNYHKLVSFIESFFYEDFEDVYTRKLSDESSVGGIGLFTLKKHHKIDFAFKIKNVRNKNKKVVIQALIDVDKLKTKLRGDSNESSSVSRQGC